MCLSYPAAKTHRVMIDYKPPPSFHKTRHGITGTVGPRTSLTQQSFKTHQPYPQTTHPIIQSLSCTCQALILSLPPCSMSSDTKFNILLIFFFTITKMLFQGHFLSPHFQHFWQWYVSILSTTVLCRWNSVWYFLFFIFCSSWFHVCFIINWM